LETNEVVHWEATYPPQEDSVGVIRGEMEAIARRCGLEETGVGDVKLAVSEAATNAVMHAYRDRPAPDGTITVTAITAMGELFIIVADDGMGMAPRADSPGLGLGLSLIATLSDRTEIITRARGTAIYMVFACPLSAAEVDGHRAADPSSWR
jgi:anti-sigma regulatory factor (Ser/Thr protein kinase)